MCQWDTSTPWANTKPKLATKTEPLLLRICRENSTKRRIVHATQIMQCLPQALASLGTNKAAACLRTRTASLFAYVDTGPSTQGCSRGGARQRWSSGLSPPRETSGGHLRDLFCHCAGMSCCRTAVCVDVLTTFFSSACPRPQRSPPQR